MRRRAIMVSHGGIPTRISPTLAAAVHLSQCSTRPDQPGEDQLEWGDMRYHPELIAARKKTMPAPRATIAATA